MAGCLHPIIINKPNPNSGLASLEGVMYAPSPNGDDFFTRVPVYSRLYGYSRLRMTVSCGKCINCLKKRQNSLAVRCMREAAKRGSMCFLTLTYDNEYLPLAISIERVDKETGQITQYATPWPLVRCDSFHNHEDASPEFVSMCRSELELIPKSPRARIIEKDLFETEDTLYRYVITPSLYRRDVRLWLKRARVRYKRDKGRSLPDFSYVVCGEMGPKTCRPHYHLAFFGLPFEDVCYLRDQWEYGFTNLKRVNAVNEDGTNGFEFASKYIGKYMSKGRFECDSVKDCKAEKPRLMMSKGLGTELDDNLISYYRCYDLFGRYDIETLVLESSGVKLTTTQLFAVFEQVRKRSFMVFGDKKYCVPHNILLKIWYVYNSVTSSFRSSQLRRLYTAYFNRDPIAVYIDKLVEDSPGITEGEISRLVSEFVASSENSNLTEEKFGENSLRAFYQKSVF